MTPQPRNVTDNGCHRSPGPIPNWMVSGADACHVHVQLFSRFRIPVRLYSKWRVWTCQGKSPKPYIILGLSSYSWTWQFRGIPYSPMFVSSTQDSCAFSVKTEMQLCGFEVSYIVFQSISIRRSSPHHADFFAMFCSNCRSPRRLSLQVPAAYSRPLQVPWVWITRKFVAAEGIEMEGIWFQDGRSVCSNCKIWSLVCILSISFPVYMWIARNWHPTGFQTLGSPSLSRVCFPLALAIWRLFPIWPEHLRFLLLQVGQWKNLVVSGKTQSISVENYLKLQMFRGLSPFFPIKSLFANGHQWTLRLSISEFHIILWASDSQVHDSIGCPCKLFFHYFFLLSSIEQPTIRNP